MSYRTQDISMKILNRVTRFRNSFLSPKSTDPDTYRVELILNSILFLFLFLLFGLFLLSLYFSFTSNPPIKPLVFIVLSSPFLIAYILSRKKFLKSASWILITVFSLGTWYAILRWDIRLPSAMLSLVLATAIVGNLISSRVGFIYAIINSVGLIIFSALLSGTYITTDISWQNGGVGIMDAVEIGLFILFTAGISWISNNQTSLSLKRARQSEQELKIERDNLEIKVAERTKEIENIQIEKISEMYTFIEFGKVSAGLIHDIMSPLTAMCIELETSETPNQTNEIKKTMVRLVESGRKIQDIVHATRKQIKLNLLTEHFYIRETINDILVLNNHRLKKANILVQIDIRPDIFIHGIRSVFTHICTNIVSNAIDSCTEKANRHVSNKTNYRPQIKITLNHRGLASEFFTISFKDNGIGIKPEDKEKIFEPFHSTKGDNGTGFGLSASKFMLEKYFEGTMSVKSNPLTQNKDFSQPGKQYRKIKNKNINNLCTEFILAFRNTTSKKPSVMK